MTRRHEQRQKSSALTILTGEVPLSGDQAQIHLSERGSFFNEPITLTLTKAQMQNESLTNHGQVHFLVSFTATYCI
jgi:hypothetical protein